MTTPSPRTLEREKDKLWVTDAELIRRWGVPERLGRALLLEFSNKHPTFPRKQELWGGRRYWPAVKAWMDTRNGLMMNAPEPRRERHVR